MKTTFHGYRRENGRVGVRNFGGVLDQQMHTLHIKALPADIPEIIEVDVTNLGIGQSLHVSDLTFTKGDILSDAGQTLANRIRYSIWK